MEKNSLKVNFSICLMIFVNCSLWLFHGIIGWKRITFFVILCGMIILCTRKFKLSRPSTVWGLYLIATIASLFINQSINSWSLYYFSMYSFIILYAILINCDVSVFKTSIVFLIFLGILNALAVMLQFFLKENFNTFYFPYLKYDGSLMTAVSYYERGYYFGLNYKPHETAGVIVFSIIALLIWGLIQTEFRKKLIYIIAICLFIPLLLTGKKGVIACMIVVFMLILLIWFASKKQWLKIAITIGLAVILFIIAVYYIMTHLDNPLFYRFASFFTRLSSGESVDAGRGDLQRAALQLWNENRLFGVGWYQFYGYTVSRFGFSRTHSVNLDYLQFLCETGIVGFVLILIPIIVMLYRTILVWKDILRIQTERKVQWIVLFAVFIQLFTVLYAFIEVPFYDIMYFTFYMLSCMIINNTYKSKKKLNNRAKSVFRIISAQVFSLNIMVR